MTESRNWCAVEIRFCDNSFRKHRKYEVQQNIKKKYNLIFGMVCRVSDGSIESLEGELHLDNKVILCVHYYAQHTANFHVFTLQGVLYLN